MREDWKTVRGPWEAHIRSLQDGVDLHVAEALEGRQKRWHMERAHELRAQMTLVKEWILDQEH